MFRKDYSQILQKTLDEIESLNYVEQFLDLLPGFFTHKLPAAAIYAFFLDNKETEFIPYYENQNGSITLNPIAPDSNLIIFLKNTREPVVLKNEKPARLSFLQKTDPGIFDIIKPDIIIPLFSIKKLYGFLAIKASGKTYKELPSLSDFFKIFANIFIPLLMSERIQLENSRNYYKIYRMDRLAMVGELAASAAHEIKNPLAGISTFLRYFTELKDFKKKDIIDELKVMKDSVHRIDEIVKSLLSFSRFKKREIRKVNLEEIIESSLHSIALKIPAEIKIIKKFDEPLTIETDSQQLQQVLINIIFNSVEAIGKKKGEIVIHTYVTGRDRLPSKERFNISVKDSGPGIDEAFKEKLFQPFQTTKEEGTGLGLYTCYGLMKSLGGSIEINSTSRGTDVVLSLPYSFDDEEDND